MPDDTSLPWTDDQWALIERTVQENASKARVASSFLPLVGPLPGGQATVPALTMLPQAAPPRGWYAAAPMRRNIDEGAVKRLTTIAADVTLTNQQARDPDLASARQLFGHAAVVVGRLEDAIVFRGQPAPDLQPSLPVGVVIDDIYTVRGGDAYTGLRTASALPNVAVPAGADMAERGNNLVTGVIQAVANLEARGHYSPFACVLGHILYQAAHTPSPAPLNAALPRDRFVPFLGGGPLLRSRMLENDEGVVIALAGSPIDLVVATDVHVSYIQRSIEPRYVLRVSERFVLRVKQTDALIRLISV